MSAPTAVAPPERCEIRDANIETADPATLLAGGISFATISDKLTRFDVVLEGKRAQVHLETEQLELVSDLRLPSFALRTRSSDLHDGWLEVRTAFARQGREGVLDAGVPLPDGVSPKVFVATLPCTAVTFAIASETDADDDDDDGEGSIKEEWIAFAPGTSTPFAKSPGGASIVTLQPEAATSLRARVLERTGRFARIEISDRNRITGWVPTEHAIKVPGLGGGGFGVGTSGIGRRRAHCPHDVPIYVDTATKIHRVGRFKAGAVILYDGPAIGDPSVTVADQRVRVELGVGEIHPHVERADLATCTAGAPVR